MSTTWPSPSAIPCSGEGKWPICRSVSSGKQRLTFPAVPRVEIDVSPVWLIDGLKAQACVHGAHLICERAKRADESILEIILDVYL